MGVTKISDPMKPRS